MNDELLKYYNRELTYIRRMGAEFAQQYPKIAGRLRLSEENVEDPHVSRLIEGFSLLTAQIRQKLDDSFPELTDALLGQLYPDYQAPIPST
ncbi:MAG: type VI secretion system baseplate subunit TssF, partial [Rheinheimera sp.]|nr:type VI secretion system baseplate subunit TssF [Rheinheimera sp.]